MIIIGVLLGDSDSSDRHNKNLTTAMSVLQYFIIHVDYMAFTELLLCTRGRVIGIVHLHPTVVGQIYIHTHIYRDRERER